MSRVDAFERVEKRTYQNGLTLFALQLPEAGYVRARFYMPLGAASDPVGEEGISHFIEHLVCANGDRAPMEIEHFFEREGGSVLLGEIDFGSSQYGFECAAKKSATEEAFRIFRTCLSDAKMERRIEEERSIILSEIARAYPSAAFEDLELSTHRLAFPDTVLSRMDRAFGRRMRVARISPSALQRHYDALYRPWHFIIFTVGKFSADEVEKLLKKTGWLDGRRPQPALSNPTPRFIDEHLPPRTERRVLSASDYGLSGLHAGLYQGHLAISGAVSDRELSLAISVLNTVLHEELRERRNLVYHAGARMARLPGFYAVNFYSKGVPLETIETLDSAIDECIDIAAGRNDIFNREISRRRMRLAYTYDPNGDDLLEDMVADVARFGRVLMIREVLRAYESLRFERVQRLLLLFKFRLRDILVP